MADKLEHGNTPESVCPLCYGDGWIDSDAYEDNYDPQTGNVRVGGGMRRCTCQADDNQADDNQADDREDAK